MDKKTLADIFKCMVLIRRFEEKIVEVYPAQDMKSPVHLYIGEEAIAAGVCAHLQNDDYVTTTHRSHGHCLAKGADVTALYAEFYGRATGCCKGKGGSMHPAFPEIGILGTSAIVGGGIPIATGAALAARLRGEDRVSVCFFGDGASEEGSFHESLNFAALKKLPVVFVCENNFYATNSHISSRQPHSEVYRKAASYGIPAERIEGNDVAAVYEVAAGMVERARRGDGPSLLEAVTYRWKGHVGPDCDHEKGCRPRSELEDWQGKCPLEAARALVIREAAMSEAEIGKLYSETDAMLDEAIRVAKAAPMPALSEITTDVYKEN